MKKQAAIFNMGSISSNKCYFGVMKPKSGHDLAKFIWNNKRYSEN